ncbi:MAG: hypothetical protein AB8F74_05470 [Saprospiraceae bacterium]
MKNTILFLATIFILQSSTLVFGQNNTVQKEIKMDQIHQIDQLSAEMMSLFRMVMEDASSFYSNGELPFAMDNPAGNLEYQSLEITIEIVFTDENSPSSWETPAFNSVAYNDMLSAQSNRFFDLFHSININTADKLELAILNSFANNGTVRNVIGQDITSIIQQSNTTVWFELEANDWDTAVPKPIPATSSSVGEWQFNVGAGLSSYY